MLRRVLRSVFWFCLVVLHWNCGTYLLLEQEFSRSNKNDPNWILAALGASSGPYSFTFSTTSLALTSPDMFTESAGSYTISVQNAPTEWATDQFSFAINITTTDCAGYILFPGNFSGYPFATPNLDETNNYSYTADLTGVGESQIKICTLNHTISSPSSGYLTVGAPIGNVLLSIPIFNP